MASTAKWHKKRLSVVIAGQMNTSTSKHAFSFGTGDRFGLKHKPNFDRPDTETESRNLRYRSYSTVDYQPGNQFESSFAKPKSKFAQPFNSNASRFGYNSPFACDKGYTPSPQDYDAQVPQSQENGRSMGIGREKSKFNNQYRNVEILAQVPGPGQYSQESIGKRIGKDSTSAILVAKNNVERDRKERLDKDSPGPGQYMNPNALQHCGASVLQNSMMKKAPTATISTASRFGYTNPRSGYKTPAAKYNVNVDWTTEQSQLKKSPSAARFGKDTRDANKIYGLSKFKISSPGPGQYATSFSDFTGAR